MAAGVINAITDLCCTLLPAFVVIKLQMPWRQKLAVASVFLAGILVNIGSAMRIYFSVQQAISGDTWRFMGPNISGAFEIGLGAVR